MKSHASSAIEKGLTAQLTNSVTPMPFQCDFTWCRAPKSIFISMGMIITQISRPTGRLTCATFRRPSAWNGAGSNCPSSTPATMHSATHRLSQRSNTLIGAAAPSTLAARLAVTSHCALIERTPSKLARSCCLPDKLYRLLQLQQLQRKRSDPPGRMAARAVRPEAPLAELIEQRLG